MYPFDTTGNIFDIESSDIQINNKPDSVITDSGSTNIHVLTTGQKFENVTVTACLKLQVNFCACSNIQGVNLLPLVLL